MSDSIGAAGAAVYHPKGASSAVGFVSGLRWRALALAFAALMVAGAIAAGVRWYSPVPTADAWDGMLQFRIQQLAGDSGTWWALHNEHRIVLARLLFWFDFKLFGGLGAFTIVANYALALAAVLVLTGFARGVHRSPRTASIATWVWSSLLAAWLFQWMQFENFTRGFQSQFFMAALLPLAALHAAYRSVGEGGRRWFVAACVLGVAAIGTMANGVLTLPLLVVYALMTRQPRSRIVLLAALAALTLAVYFHGYRSVPGHGCSRSA